MFNCYLHGWSSLRSKCPKCIRYEISTSMTTQELKIYMPDKNHELESRIKTLEVENTKLREIIQYVLDADFKGMGWRGYVLEKYLGSGNE